MSSESEIAPNNNEKETQYDDDIERSEIQGELSTMSFEDLMRLKEELGSKVYNEAIFGSSTKHKNRIAKTKSDFKRLNKNRPREMSSKRPVPLIGGEERQLGKNETLIRDPRFDEKCGDYNSKVFKENYSFINDIRQNEIDELKEKLNSATINDDEKSKIKFLIQRLENQNREEKARKLKEESMREEIVEINKAKREGKQPHYTTKKERRTKELVQQYEELKKSGRLGKHLEKRRKKNTAKDRKKFSFD